MRLYSDHGAWLSASAAPARRIAARAQSYPSKVIKLVVPAGPGGPTDVLARLIGDRMTAALGQSVIVDNRPGAGGAIAAKAVAGAEPDGYTLLFGNTATLANIPAVSKSAGYDPVEEFRGRRQGDGFATRSWSSIPSCRSNRSPT